ncbi:diacylglycerol kinase [Thermodesulfobacteriota bacterium]
MEEQKNRGLRRLIKATGYSLAGLRAAWKNEEAFRQEISVLILVIPAGLLLGTSFTQRALLIGIYLIVPLTELLNSAIEAIIDRIGSDHHVLSGRAKDLGSAAVLLSICIALIVWVLVAMERFIS